MPDFENDILISYRQKENKSDRSMVISSMFKISNHFHHQESKIRYVNLDPVKKSC